MTKAFTTTISLLFSCQTMFSQVGGTDQLRDSLKHDLAIAKTDTSRVLTMAQLSSAYNGFYPDSVNFYGNEALRLADQINYPRGKARALIALGLGVQLEGEYPKSFEYLYRSLQIAQERHFVLESAICYSSIGNNYWFLGDYPKAVDNATKAQHVYRAIFDIPEVREWMLFNILLIGQSYLEYQLDSSYKYLSQYHDSTVQDKFWHPVALYNLGDCMFRRGDHANAFTYTRAGIAGSILNGDNLTESEACATISSFFGKTRQSDSAIYYAGQGLEAANSIAYGLGVYKNSKVLAEEYEQTDVLQALRYRKIYDSANESMFGLKKVQELQKTLAEEQHRQQLILHEQIEKENRLKQYGFMGGLAILLLVAFLLYRNNLHKKKANDLLQYQKKKVENTLTELRSTQAQLIQSEKMASLGELTAGIAHEIQNPLNFVNNFSETSKELLNEMSEALEKGEVKEAREMMHDIVGNLEKINTHGKRADGIVKSMLQHSRTSSGQKTPTDINDLCDEYLRLTYHGLRAKDNSFNAIFKTEFDPAIGNINIVPQEIGRVLLNLVNNAFHAVTEKAKTETETYQPTVTVATKKLEHQVEISVKDNGYGVPASIRAKIFQPFFTTKPTGQGTGLGLSLSYDIVKAHGGTIRVESSEGKGTTFIIHLSA